MTNDPVAAEAAADYRWWLANEPLPDTPTLAELRADDHLTSLGDALADFWAGVEARAAQFESHTTATEGEAS